MIDSSRSGVYSSALPHHLAQRPLEPRALSLREFFGTYGSHTSLLTPPYHSAQPLTQLDPSYQPPLGAIAAAHGRDLLVVVSELWVVMQQWPWVVPCLTLTPDQWQSERLLKLFPDLSIRLAVGKIQSASDVGLKATIAAARRRSFPTPHVMAHWVCQRIGLAAYYLSFLAQFEHALGGMPASRVFSVATASRRFARLGRYTARDWRALARLAVEACAVTSNADSRLRRHGARYLHKYLNLPVKCATTLLGWEWVLEQALRVGGYVRITERASAIS